MKLNDILRITINFVPNGKQYTITERSLINTVKVKLHPKHNEQLLIAVCYQRAVYIV